MILFERRVFTEPVRVICLLWLFATALNLNKAFHMDDTFHLEAAHWIQQNPLRPMSGEVNWTSNNQPLHFHNQPPLYFYLVAGWASLFGYSEIALHLFQSVFTLLAIVFFYKIARILSAANALLLTALFALNPAFVVNQNLMVDVPVLSLHLAFIYLLLKPDFRKPIYRYVLAGLVLSTALMIKYSSLPLFVLLFAAPLFRREPKYIAAAFIPVLVLGIWSVVNYLEFGAYHLFGRAEGMRSLTSILLMAFSYVFCLGGIAPFIVAFIPGLSVKHAAKTRLLTLVAVSVFLLICALWFAQIISSSTARKLFWGGFVLNGFLVLALVVVAVHAQHKKTGTWLNNTTKLLLLWLAGMAGFIVVFAPFMATRHVLLIIPALLLLCSPLLEKAPADMKKLAVGLSLSLSALLGISDWVLADFYRKQAPAIKAQLSQGTTVWSLGHWGWQWYATQAGMKQYQQKDTTIAINDVLVAPKYVSKQKLLANIQTKEIARVVPKATAFTSFSTGIFASFYISDCIVAPWALSHDPVDTIKIMRVTKILPHK